ncbi:MAG: YncE family protein [Hansschlegelia sp.]
MSLRRAVAALGLLGLAAGPAQAEGPAFAVVSQAGAAVSFLTASGQIDGEAVAIDDGPASIAAGPDGHTLYVAHPDRARITVVDAVTRTVTEKFNIAGSPFGAAATDTEVYATDWAGGKLVKIDALTGASTGSVAIGKAPAGLALDVKHSRAYSANRESDSVSVVDLKTMTAREIKVGRAPFALGLSPDGARLFVANVRSGDLSVIDVLKDVEIARVPVGRMPYGVAVTPDGERIAVTLQEEAALVLLDAATLEQGGRAKVGKYPEGVAISHDGRTAAVANWFDDTVSLVDLATMKALPPVATPKGPRNIATLAP